MMGLLSNAVDIQATLEKIMEISLLLLAHFIVS